MTSLRCFDAWKFTQSRDVIRNDRLNSVAFKKVRWYPPLVGC